MRRLTKLKSRALAVFFFLLFFFLGQAAFLPPPAYSGSLGDSSTDSVGTISFEVKTLFLVSGFTDFGFTYSGSGELKDDRTGCVWTNSPSPEYKVRARGSGASYAFTVEGPGETGVQTIPYTVAWNNNASTSGNVPLDPDDISDLFTGASNSAQDCGGSPNANVEIVFNQSSLRSVPPGGYEGTLSITVGLSEW